VTLVDKANVFVSFAFMRQVFHETAAKHPDIDARHHYVDAMALDLVRRPWDFDVLPMENLFGDILSDLGAGLIGGMGFAPSADIGAANGMFQPSHGTAPDIAGKGIANPTAMILSVAMMLDWLGETRGSQAAVDAGRAIEKSVDHAFGTLGLRSHDIGGSNGTAAAISAGFTRMPGTAWQTSASSVLPIAIRRSAPLRRPCSRRPAPSAKSRRCSTRRSPI
jgi:3-isopropylmalate dehydrogenase